MASLRSDGTQGQVAAAAAAALRLLATALWEHSPMTLVERTAPSCV